MRNTVGIFSISYGPGCFRPRVADRDEYGYTWTLMTDPEGNEFGLGKAL